MSDLQTKGQERFGRLCRLLGSAEPVASPGEAAAMSWLAEHLTQQRIAAACPGRTLAIDFDAFLGDPGLHLRAIFQHLSLQATPALIDGIAAHRLMHHYAKSPNKAYSAATRAERLRQSRRDQGEEIGRGLAWLERMAGTHPSTAAALAG